ncbi:MAG: LytTR family transcriptional regulator DNA-binding domain-containing protein [Bacteroidales bacterium]|nr:LytTR family transcriptional regulator DNA-binding domain-containing protein [Bacteroidales bacterium]
MKKEKASSPKDILKRLHAIFRRTGERIIIGDKSSQQIYYVDPDSLMYIDAVQNYTNWFFSDGTKIMPNCQLHECEELISNQISEDAITLARVGRSNIVNLKYIAQLDMAKREIVISNHRNFSERISVSEESIKQLKEATLLYKESNENE